MSGGDYLEDPGHDPEPDDPAGSFWAVTLFLWLTFVLVLAVMGTR